MRLGFFLPQLGPAASPESIVRVARRAEELGYDSVWVTERLLFPIAPQSPYAGTPDGSLPGVYKISYDPIETLTYVAARTQRVALGTSVLVMPYYNPIVLARRLTTLDVLSNGRLRVGLGLGWSKDEHDATNASMKNRGALADEFLDVLKAIWTADPVEFEGRFFQVPRSIIQPKPVKKPHPPVYLAAFTPRGLKRAATKANGWHPVGLPADAMRQMAGSMRGMAKEAGRDPGELQVVVRANFLLSPEPMGDDRFIYTGSEDQLKADIKATRDLGADELIFDPAFSPAGQSVDGFLSTMEKMKELAA